MTYVGAVRAALAVAGDPERAAQQRAYMKSELPFAGLGAPALRAMLKPLLVEHRFIDRGSWEVGVLELWDDATHREEWYAAIALVRHRSYRQWVDPDLLRDPPRVPRNAADETKDAEGRTQRVLKAEFSDFRERYSVAAPDGVMLVHMTRVDHAGTG